MTSFKKIEQRKPYRDIMDSNYSNLRVRVSSKYIFDDYNCLLNNVIYFNLDQLQQDTDAAFSSSLQLDGTATNSTNSLPNKIYIYFCGILLKLQ